MKTTPVSLIVAGLLVPALAAEGERPPPPPHEPDRGPHDHRSFAKAWKDADSDGDGEITREEFDAMERTARLPEDKRARIFQRLDKDGDGRLGKPEIRRILRRDPPHGGPMPPIWELDTDRDGGVSFAEFQAAPVPGKLDPEKQRRIFDRLDTDGDGMITPRDKPRQRPRPEGAPPHPGHHLRGLLERLDADGDRSLSFEEFRKSPRISELDPEQQRARFESMDKNRDGRVNRKDLPQRAGRPEGPRPPGPGHPPDGPNGPPPGLD